MLIFFCTLIFFYGKRRALLQATPIPLNNDDKLFPISLKLLPDVTLDKLQVGDFCLSFFFFCLSHLTTGEKRETDC